MVYDRPEDAERVSTEDAIPLYTPAEARERYSRDLAWALGVPSDAELPDWGDLLQQVRVVRNVREESVPPPIRIVADAILALYHNWDKLTPAQQYNCREDLRTFAKTLPKIDPKTLPSSGEW